MIQTLWKTIWQYVLKLNNLYYNDIAILLLVIYTREMTVYVNKIRCKKKKFIESLFIMSQTENVPDVHYQGNTQINCGIVI